MRLGTALHTALILGGTTYLQDLLFPMNFSNAWLEANTDLIRLATHRKLLIGSSTVHVDHRNLGGGPQ